MIVSWNWLKEYVQLEMPLDALTERLTMAGLNLESTHPVDDDTAIDLEVTSNRPDCLGHIGVAREAGVLFGLPLTVPPSQVQAVAEKTAAVTSVQNHCEDLCPQYFARVIRGVKIAPSPDWLRRRLTTLGIAAINNVVDITNYVLMECGQPLHAFDFDKLRDRRIVVRRAHPGERLVAIDQRTYELDAEMCVIADADRPVAIGGVMGGLETEIGDRTVNVLIETAEFAPMSIRNTARKLNLHSDSSYRFERGVDPLQLDWASRRCCELVLELAGGELLDQPVIAGTLPPIEREPITLRFEQIKRILGVGIPAEEAVRILTALGLKESSHHAPREERSRGGERGRGGDADEEIPLTPSPPHPLTSSIPREEAAARQPTHPRAERADYSFIPPSWRRDLTREADLIEEVARIYGYDKIPEDAVLPVVSTAKSLRDRVTERVREVLTATGFFEAITLSFVTDELCDLFTPHCGPLAPRVDAGHAASAQQTPPERLRVEHSSRRHENVLRQSLIPSLLNCRRENERHGTFNAQLFEIAKVYLSSAHAPRDVAAAESPTRPLAERVDYNAKAEPTMIGCVSGRSFAELKGVIETLAQRLNHSAVVTVRPSDIPQFAAGRGAEVSLNGLHWGCLGELDRAVTDRLDLRDAVTVAELDLAVLEAVAELVPVYMPAAPFPAVPRDLNFVLDEAVTWQELEETVRATAGELLDSLSFGGQYRGPQIPPNKKSYVVTIRYRSPNRTLTSEEVDHLQTAIIAACEKKLGAALR